MPFEDVCQNANAIKKVLIFGNSDKQIDYLIFGRFLYGTYTSLTFQNIPADGHIQTSTPTVRGHAEACPSTTYGKYLHRRLHIPLGGWGGPQNAQGGAGRVLRRRRIISYNTSILHGCFRGDFGI